MEDRGDMTRYLLALMLLVGCAPRPAIRVGPVRQLTCVAYGEWDGRRNEDQYFRCYEPVAPVCTADRLRDCATATGRRP
jgi:hypothetical protein